MPQEASPQAASAIPVAAWWPVTMEEVQARSVLLREQCHAKRFKATPRRYRGTLTTPQSRPSQATCDRDQHARPPAHQDVRAVHMMYMQLRKASAGRSAFRFGLWFDAHSWRVQAHSPPAEAGRVTKNPLALACVTPVFCCWKRNAWLLASWREHVDDAYHVGGVHILQPSPSGVLFAIYPYTI